jgi:hypothetical protein
MCNFGSIGKIGHHAPAAAAVPPTAQQTPVTTETNRVSVRILDAVVRGNTVTENLSDGTARTVTFRGGYMVPGAAMAIDHATSLNVPTTYE